MLQWCMAHPWMTFWLAVLLILAVDSAITNLCRLGNNLIRLRYYKKSMEDQEDSNE